MTVEETHHRLRDLVFREGTAEERAEMIKVELLLEELFEVDPGATYEPMEEIKLPSFLIVRAERTASKRHATGRARLHNVAGARRSIGDEIRTVEAQYACCLMIGHPFDIATTHEVGRKRGNLGGGFSAFCPRPGNNSLIVGEKEPLTRTLFMLDQVGEHRYQFVGWMRSREAKQGYWRKTFTRDGQTSSPYLVPRSALHPLAAWFK